MERYCYPEPSPFPPSFEGNPFSYLFGLFGDVAAPGIVVAVLLALLFDARHRKQAEKLESNLVRQEQPPRWSTIHVYRLFIRCLFGFVIMRSMPDGLWMLAWGEVSEPVIRALLLNDILMDGSAVFLLLAGMFFWSWSRQSVQHLLANGSTTALPPPSFRIIWPNLKIVALVLGIAVGVTIGKASA